MHRSYFYDHDFANDIMQAIEAEYGKTIKRIARFEEKGDHFYLLIVFDDYKILDARLKVQLFFDMPSIQIEGHYY
jgi:hypothetical protein